AFEVGPLSNLTVPKTLTDLFSLIEGKRHYFCFGDEPDPEPHWRQEQALVIQRNKRNAELVQENDLLKSTLSGKEKSIAFLQSEKEKILSEKEKLADSMMLIPFCIPITTLLVYGIVKRS
ncbi:hypothetical protein Tco_1580387, partial [Tanacetum coccineum]